ncbi:hypothetical protein QOZ75_29735, partial [Pseudomonas aeruginosa]|uniref:hypothetical protein n=1 Tax=Pseudomonas aeruginosa TaxID=287 RepID=UPI003458FF1C
IIRTPVRLDLPQFAEWRREKVTGQRGRVRGTGHQTEAEDPSLLESYIAGLIERTSGEPFAVKDFYEAAGERPMLIASNGLD